MKIQDENYSHTKDFGSYHVVSRGTKTEYKSGSFYTKNGIVIVYAEPKTEWSDKQLIRLDFSYQGRDYHRTLYNVKSTSDRSLSVFAGKFVRDIVTQ